jgi:hypothetical protein
MHNFKKHRLQFTNFQRHNRQSAFIQDSTDCNSTRCASSYHLPSYQCCYFRHAPTISFRCTAFTQLFFASPYRPQCHHSTSRRAKKLLRLAKDQVHVPHAQFSEFQAVVHTKHVLNGGPVMSRNIMPLGWFQRTERHCNPTPLR